MGDDNAHDDAVGRGPVGDDGAGGGTSLWAAGVNTADQTALAGTGSALDRARDAARDAGAWELRRLAEEPGVHDWRAVR